MINSLLCIILSSLAGAILVWVLIDLLLKSYINAELIRIIDKKQTTIENRESLKDYLKKKYKVDSGFLKEFSLLAFLSGFFEIFMYSISISVLKPEFIILWVGIKTALRWDRHNKKNYTSELEIEISDAEKRGVYYCFLIGNALTIIIGFFIAYHLNPNIY